MDSPIVTQPDAGDVIASDESFTVRVKVAREEIVMTEQRLGPHAKGPPSHFHRRHCDSFYVVSGRLSLLLGEEEAIFEPGAMVTVPPGVVHTFFNPDATPAVFLNIHTPGVQFDRYLIEINAAFEAGADKEEIAAIQARYDSYMADSP